jgi:3-isopropylmalate dehydrogenase
MSLAMLLDHVGQGEAAAWVEAAVVADLSSRGSAPRSTSEVGDALTAAAVSASGR